MKRPKVKVICKKVKTPCYCCDKVGGIPCKRSICKVCHGTGQYTEKHYIMIVGKTAYDMDTIK
jgi:DnaJ-class molecular chaperone